MEKSPEVKFQGLLEKVRYYEDHKSMGGIFQPHRKHEKSNHNDGEKGGGSSFCADGDI